MKPSELGSGYFFLVLIFIPIVNTRLQQCGIDISERSDGENTEKENAENSALEG